MIKKLLVVALASLSMNASADNWTGPYIGISASYVENDDQGSRPVASSWTNDIAPTGASLELYTGYNWQFAEKALLSIEASYSNRSDVAGSDSLKSNGVHDDYYRLDTSIEDVLSLTARLGRLFNESRSVAYLLVGISKADVTRTWLDDPVSPTLDRHTHTQTGWIAGIGLEHAYNDNLSLKAEYKYTDYGSETMYVDLWGETWTQELTEQSLTIGASYRF